MFIIQEEISNLRHLEDMSNASGDSMPARNAACHFKCNFKRKSKRADCWRDCDRRFPRSEGQAQRRDEQSQRRTARNIKRDTVDECKDLYKSGQINKIEETNCIKNARETKRETIEEKGGGKFLQRVGRGFTKVFPITAAGRGGALVLIKKNASGFATRLSPALVPEAEAKQKFRPDAIAAAKKGWEKVTKSWKNLGGNEFKLRDAILEGYRKKPTKLPRSEQKSSIAGFNPYSNQMWDMEYENYSNLGGAEWAAIATAGAGVLVALINMIGRAGVKKDPFLSENIDPNYTDGMRMGNVEDNLPFDPNQPVLNDRGEWVDPNTGRPVDPRTGQQTILGMNPYLAIGLGVVVLAGVGVVTYKLVNK